MSVYHGFQSLNASFCRDCNSSQRVHKCGAVLLECMQALSTACYFKYGSRSFTGLADNSPPCAAAVLTTSCCSWRSWSSWSTTLRARSSWRQALQQALQQMQTPCGVQQAQQMQQQMRMLRR